MNKYLLYNVPAKAICFIFKVELATLGHYQFKMTNLYSSLRHSQTRLIPSEIYKITEIETGRVYIGQSTDVRTRWSNHLKTIVGTDGGAARTRFHDYVAKVGIDKFTFELLEDCPKEQLNEREKFFIEFYHANDWGFNSTAGNKG